MTLLSSLHTFAYSLKHPPPIQYTIIFAILKSSGILPRLEILIPNSLISFYLRSLTFSIYLVNKNLSPLLKLPKIPNVNFLIIFPPIIPIDPLYDPLPSLLFS